MAKSGNVKKVLKTGDVSGSGLVAAKKPAKKPVKKVKIKILAPVAGKYHLSFNVGDEITIDVNQAAAMVENKDAAFVK
tara:strand:+ start:3333 stop:3566 length:234 start_codon:yes stop_codon:yes gene_type:complete